MNYWVDFLTASARINVRREIAVIRAKASMHRTEDALAWHATEAFVDAIDAGAMPRVAAEIAKFRTAQKVAEWNGKLPNAERIPVTLKNDFLDGLAERLRLAASSERAVA